jgi:hypothetical protein
LRKAPQVARILLIGPIEIPKDSPKPDKYNDCEQNSPVTSGKGKSVDSVDLKSFCEVKEQISHGLGMGGEHVDVKDRSGDEGSCSN